MNQDCLVGPKEKLEMLKAAFPGEVEVQTVGPDYVRYRKIDKTIVTYAILRSYFCVSNFKVEIKIDDKNSIDWAIEMAWKHWFGSNYQNTTDLPNGFLEAL